MKNYARDPILGNGLIFDFALSDTMPALLASALATAYTYDRGPNRIVATAVSFVAGTWVIETPGITPIMTIDLDGTADCVNCGTGAWFDLATNVAPGVTFEAAMLPDAVGDETIMGGWRTAVGGACYPHMIIEANGYVEFRPTQYTAETSVVTGSVNITGGTHHIVATFAESDDVAEIWVDGGNTDHAAATLSCSNPNLSDLGAENFWLGCRNNTAAATEAFFNGHLYWVRMWARRLSRGESLLLYERAKTVLGL